MTVLERPLLLDARETSRTLGIGERTLWSITCPRGTLPAVRIGRTVRYSPADLARYIDAQRVATSVDELEGGAR